MGLECVLRIQCKIFENSCCELFQFNILLSGCNFVLNETVSEENFSKQHTRKYINQGIADLRKDLRYLL